MNLFQPILLPVQGILLAYVGWQHILLAGDLRGVRNLTTVLFVLIPTIWTGNLAIGFISAAVLYFAWSWFISRTQHHVN